MDLIVWELVCYRLEIKDVINLFKSCKTLLSLAMRQSLWSFLMQRDFNEHYKLSQISEHQEWYKDLHQFGAFFHIGMSVPLLPYGVLYVGSGVGKNAYKRRIHDPSKVMTIRRRMSERDLLRYPHQNFLAILQRSELNEKQSLFLPSVDPREIDYCYIEKIKMVFLHSRDKIRFFMSLKIRQWDGNKFAPIVKWMSDHFEVENASYCEGEVMFKGKLREGHTLEPGSSGQSAEFREKSTEYKFGYSVFGPEIRLYNRKAQAYFRSINGDIVPNWKNK